jgi:hypothetical protein
MDKTIDEWCKAQPETVIWLQDILAVNKVHLRIFLTYKEDPDILDSFTSNVIIILLIYI